MNLPYDPTSRESILQYARELLGKSLRIIYPNATPLTGGKGLLGQCVEKIHFQYVPNSESRPDFPEAGLELKCTPLKENVDGSMVAKERLVLNIIDYVREAQATFETSSFWKKNSCLLLMFYLSEKGVDVMNLFFKIVRIWDFPDIDLKIIQDDWKKLHRMMENGRAHEISEGDTLYLSACMKGAKSNTNLRQQYGEGTPYVPQRAYSLKAKYLNTIILDSLNHLEMCQGMYVSDKQKTKIRKKAHEVRNLVNSVDEYQEGETFENLIERKFRSYYGKTIYEIESLTRFNISRSPKAISNAVIHAILGVKTQKIGEFEKSNLQQKSIRLEANGRLVESMVFDQIRYKEIVKEEYWEESALYNILTQRFLFVVFRKDVSSDNMKAVLEKVFFWTMPQTDLAVAKEFWNDTKARIAADDFEHFWKLSDQRIFHVRPKAVNSKDTMEAPSGRQIVKKAYWLNAKYVLEIVKEHS